MKEFFLDQALYFDKGGPVIKGMEWVFDGFKRQSGCNKSKSGFDAGVIISAAGKMKAMPGWLKSSHVSAMFGNASVDVYECRVKDLVSTVLSYYSFSDYIETGLGGFAREELDALKEAATVKVYQ